MIYKRYLLVTFITAVFGWVSWVLVIMKLDPCTAPGEITICHSVSSLALILFFLSAFFALTAILSLFGFGLRLWFHRNEIYLDHFNVSLRQGILLTFCVLGALGLLLLNALTWWSGFLLIFIVVMLEFYFTRSD